jgi:hypothetical protein
VKKNPWSSAILAYSLGGFGGKQKPRSELAVNTKYLDFQDNFDKLYCIFKLG